MHLDHRAESTVHAMRRRGLRVGIYVRLRGSMTIKELRILT